MKKIKTGIYGLDPLIGGGFTEHTSTVVIGAPGTGKTTFALQYILAGLSAGQRCIFVSLDENRNQILKEAEMKGWSDILDFEDEEKLVFVDASGKKFADFIRDELPPFVNAFEGSNVRIVVDPLTPVIWAVENKYSLRELLLLMLRDMKKIGTVVCTVEEHSVLGTLQGEETITPMYLADNVIHLRHASNTPSGFGELKIIKSRTNKHDHISHPYIIVGGIGIIVFRMREESTISTQQSRRKALETLEKFSDKLPRTTFELLRAELSRLTDKELEALNELNILKIIMNELESD